MRLRIAIVLLLPLHSLVEASNLRGIAPDSIPGVDATTSAQNETLSIARDLGQSRCLANILDFVPLSCNRKLETATCTPWSTRIGTNAVHSKRVTIQCGECIVMDHKGSTLTFNNGLDIRGKLVFPDGYSLHVISTMIVVQGHLEMTATKKVDGNPSIRFTMVGDDEQQSFLSMGDNKGKCGGDYCYVGKKSITVAGGKVNSKCVYCCEIQF